MMMTRLIYASKVSTDCGPKDIRKILASARTNNAREGVTGLLCCDPLYFMQWLEGGRDAVNRIYSLIIQDPRHHTVTLLDYGEILRRDFTQWAMAYVTTTDMDGSVALAYSPSASFDPMSMCAESARSFLLHLAQLRQESLGQGLS